MMVSISLSNHFRRHAKEPGCFPNWNAALHEPGRRRVTERVWRNTRKAGECRRSGEPGLNRPNRLPVPFDEMASSAKPCPATHMSQQPRGNWNRRLALVRRTLADCEPVKHASIKIDVGAAREIWGSSALVLNLAVIIEISSPGMARGFLSVFAVFA